MSRKKLPAWAEAAIREYRPPAPESTETAARYDAIVARILDRWDEISGEVLPSLRRLSDRGKQAVFESVLHVAWYYPSTWSREARAARREVIGLTEKIRRLADELAEAMRKRDELVERYKLHDDSPTLPDVIEELAEQYSHWAVATDARRFWIDARTTTQRSKPSMADVVQVFARDVGVPYDDGLYLAAFRSREDRADPVRMLIAYTRFSHNAWVPDDFRLTARAIMVLANVLFDAGFTTEDAVRKQRKSMFPDDRNYL